MVRHQIWIILFNEKFYLDNTLCFVESEPRASPMRRSGKGVRLHALRIKKSQQQNYPRRNKAMGSMFNSWAKRKASLTHVLRVRKDFDGINNDLD